jgi:adenosylcobinamide-GDP ribazoletransferase
MKKLLLAFQFLTIIPVKNSMTIKDADVAGSSSAFVIVGLVQGILLIVTGYVSGRVFHPDLVIGIILLVLVLSNGGFHLDGLADTFDAIAAKSEGNVDIDKQKRLLIMKDSKTGPIGVIAIVFALLLKFLTLNSLYHFSLFTFHFSLFFMPILSKWTMVISMFYGKPAREDGLGRLFINNIRGKDVVISTLILFSILILLQVFFSYYISSGQYIFYAVLLVTMYFLCRAWIYFFHKKFGGLTGDTLGAISEITEIIFLLMVIAWSRLSI